MCPTSQTARIAVALVLLGVCAKPSAADVVVSQIYGGGGNAGALLKLDFVELFNRGVVAHSIDGWSMQYASATASSWQVTPLSGTIQPGAYYLVQLGGGSGGSIDLPPADAVGITNMSAAAGKVALVAGVAPLGLACPSDASIRDFVGYGTANCFEGSAPAPAGTNTAALVRSDAGCGDTADNAADFGAGTPNPRNQSAPLHLCSPASPTETSTADPSMTPTDSVTPSASPTPSPEDTATSTTTPTPSETVTEVPTSTDSPTRTETETPTASSTPPASSTATSSSTPNHTCTATATETQSPSPNESPVPSATISDTPTPTVPGTPTSTHSPQTTASACGNALAEPGEQCDDGNDVDGDLCPNGCSYRSSGALIHGNHRLRMVRGDGCQVEWYVADMELTRDAFGFASTTQACVDQDPGCDFDPGENRCRFAVVVCMNNTDPALPGCVADGISSSAIVHPPDTRRGDLRATNRASLAHALSHLVDPGDPQSGAVNDLPLSAGETDFCSQPFAVDIDLQGAGAGVMNLIVDTFSADGRAPRRERARLRLICTS